VSQAAYALGSFVVQAALIPLVFIAAWSVFKALSRA
jgi:hypothetical protein